MMFDLWPVYSGERFRASWPSWFLLWARLCHASYPVCGQVFFIWLLVRIKRVLIRSENLSFLPYFCLIIWPSFAKNFGALSMELWSRKKTTKTFVALCIDDKTYLSYLLSCSSGYETTLKINGYIFRGTTLATSCIQSSELPLKAN